jgi:KAP family P-loop domain
MSAVLVEKEIERFLASPEPEVLCLRGKWGVGKTHSWEAILRKARDRGAIALNSYAYVSLFGRDSLAQLKYAIFENGMSLADIGAEPTVETFKSNAAALFKRIGKQSFSFLQNLPQPADYASELQALSFLSVRDRLICVDDLERMGQHLLMKDVLGLISDLRDQKGCKVVIILNDDALEGTAKAEFELYNEKVIDRSLEIAPDATDSVRVAVIGDDPALQNLRTALIALGIANIRIIKKIERLVLHVTPLLKDFDVALQRQAVRSLTLLGWSVYSKDAPTLDYLREQRAKHVFGLGEGGEVSEQVKEWNALLDGIGFTTLDEFDLVLLNGIERGYFDEPQITALAAKRAETIKASQAGDSFDAAWRLYADSFDDNEMELARQIGIAVRKNVAFVSPLNLNAAVRLLKDLDRPLEASEMLNQYITQRKDGRAFFDLSIYPFAGDITDPDVKAAFEKRYLEFSDDRAPADVLLSIARTRNCAHADIAVLSKLTADDFQAMFKAQKGADRARLIHAAIQLDRMTGAGDEAKAVAAVAKAALKKIAGENALNRRRVLQLLDKNVLEDEAKPAGSDSPSPVKTGEGGARPEGSGG